MTVGRLSQCFSWLSLKSRRLRYAQHVGSALVLVKANKDQRHPFTYRVPVIALLRACRR